MIASSAAWLTSSVARTAGRWLVYWGGLGLIPVGILDDSVLPLPAGMDFLVIFLAARNPRLWWYYALMATIGSVIGGLFTYRLARKGGKETLERYVKAGRVQSGYGAFDRRDS